MGAMQEVLLPDIGDFKEVDVIEVLVRPGDTIKPEQSLITVESDKATMEIPSPSGGVVKELRVKEGDKISKGTLILVLDSAGAGAAAPEKDAKAAAPVAKKAEAEPQRQAAPQPQPQPQPPARGAGATREVTVPDIGDFKEVDVVEILVKPGDTVSKDQSLVSLESDKATMEIPSPAAGVVKEIRLKVGDKAAKGTPILLLAESGEASAPAAPTAAPGQEAAPAPASVRASSAPAPAALQVTRADPVPYEPDTTGGTFKPHASPSVRKFARELGVDLARVKGSGPKGRITQEDVQAFVKSAMQGAPAAGAAPSGGGLGFQLLDWPQVDFAKFGPVETKALSRIRKVAGANLHRNWVSIPHVTQFDEADITELEAFRKENSARAEKQGVKLTLLAFLIKATVTALREFPDFNASLDKGGESLVLKKYYHIGVAVDTPDGLVVPVIRDADRKGVFDLARELAETSRLAREKKLKPGDMQGGTFSISSLGGIGGTAFTPIINAPEVAILGVSRSAMRPVYKDGQFVPRLILPLSLSYDHRVVDGATGARFTSYVASVLSDIRRTLL
jgi:pyruvate dehydrogenase E2 component (dihydrolipoamide acetyltransferase)